KVEADATHAGFVQAQQLGIADAVIDDAGGAIVCPRDARQRFLEVGVIAHVIRWLHEHAAAEADNAVHGERVLPVGFKGLVNWIGIAVGVARRIAEDVQVTVATHWRQWLLWSARRSGCASIFL